jgi:GMP synthase-like glutamine amidotransferase
MKTEQKTEKFQPTWTLKKTTEINDWDKFVDFTHVVLLGGAMNIGEEKLHSWLLDEYRWVEALLKKNVKFLGLCLGSQILAHVLGARVYEQNHWEVGFHKVEFKEGSSHIFFHWHKFASELPKNAQLIASSRATPVQAFKYTDQILAYQFHPEAEVEWVISCLQDPIPLGPFSQTQEQMISFYPELPKIHQWFQPHLEDFFTKP